MTDWPKAPTCWIEARTLYVSVPFTWLLPAVKTMLAQRDFLWDKAIVGGPAVRLIPTYLEGLRDTTIDLGDCPGVLQRVNPEATKSTTGCVRKCKFCSVPDTEGALVELDDWPDLPVICDNNILAASNAHFDRVCDRLELQDWSDFQGIDARLLSTHHAARLAGLPSCIVRLAYDSPTVRRQWDRAFGILLGAGFPKSRVRSYVLCGFGHSPESAWAICEYIKSCGARPLPQWYHPLDAMTYNAVLPCHREHGWDEKERDRIMQYYYKHRGEKGPQKAVDATRGME